MLWGQRWQPTLVFHMAFIWLVRRFADVLLLIVLIRQQREIKRVAVNVRFNSYITVPAAASLTLDM